MKQNILHRSALAALGGTAVFPENVTLPWPPTDKATERDLVALYRSGSWSWSGRWERHLCQEMARIHTSKHCALMANGTVTLEAALHALGIKAGDEVIVPSLTWIATAMAVLYAGAKPVFVDIEADSFCLDPVQVEAAITSRTKAIIPVHLYGGMADMDRLLTVARKYKLAVIEDCAHAQGGMWNGKGLGSLGDVGSFSFQQSKALSCGEGGAVVTNDSQLYDRMFRFKHIGYPSGALQGKAASSPPEGLDCRNYRGTEYQALVLRGQLQRIESRIVKRGKAAEYLTRELEKIPGIRIQARGRRADKYRQSFYAFMMVFDSAHWNGADAARIAFAANKENLSVFRTYGPVYEHILWNVAPKRYRIGAGKGKASTRCAVAETEIHPHALGVLHTHLDLPRRDLSRIVDVFAKLHHNADRLNEISI